MAILLSLPGRTLKVLPGVELTDADQVLGMGKPRPREREDQGGSHRGHPEAALHEVPELGFKESLWLWVTETRRPSTRLKCSLSLPRPPLGLNIDGQGHLCPGRAPGGLHLRLDGVG